MDFKGMDIYLLRHGQSTANEKHLVCGDSDYPLSELGRTQALLACRNLNKLKFDRIYSSPLSRALQTISGLQQEAQVVVVHEIVELNTGSVSDMTVTELWDKDHRYRYQGLYPDHKYPGGECLHDMLRRVQAWFDTERENWSQNDKILISGHEGTVCGILHGLLKLEITHYPTFVVGNCDYIHISINQDAQVRIKFVNLAGK